MEYEVYATYYGQWRITGYSNTTDWREGSVSLETNGQVWRCATTMNCNPNRLPDTYKLTGLIKDILCRSRIIISLKSGSCIHLKPIVAGEMEKFAEELKQIQAGTLRGKGEAAFTSSENINSNIPQPSPCVEIKFTGASHRCSRRAEGVKKKYKYMNANARSKLAHRKRPLPKFHSVPGEEVCMKMLRGNPIVNSITGVLEAIVVQNDDGSTIKPSRLLRNLQEGQVPALVVLESTDEHVLAIPSALSESISTAPSTSTTTNGTPGPVSATPRQSLKTEYVQLAIKKMKLEMDVLEMRKKYLDAKMLKLSKD